MKNDDFSLKNVDEETAEKIAVDYPVTSWNMDKTFNMSYRKFLDLKKSSIESGETVLSDPVEIVKPRKFNIYGYMAFASIILCVVVFVGMIKLSDTAPPPPDEISKPPLLTNTTTTASTTITTKQTTLTTKSTATTATSTATTTTSTTVTTMSTTLTTKQPTVATETTATTEQITLTTEQATITTEITTTTAKKEYTTIPSINNFDSEESFIAEVVQGVKDGKYMLDFDENGKIDMVESQLILAYYADIIMDGDNIDWDGKTIDIQYFEGYNDYFSEYYEKTEDSFGTVFFEIPINNNMLENVKKYGDVNGDGLINSLDSSYILIFMNYF